MVNKSKLFYSFVLSSQIDIFSITETWCTPDIYDLELFPPNFAVYRKDRNSRGGDVLIGVNNSISSTQLSSPESLELICVELLSPKPVTICLIYIPPVSSDLYISTFLNYIRSLSTNNLIILGDFNFPDINCSSLTGTSASSNQFCDLVFDLNLTQLIDFPTHTKGNILDLVLTNSTDLISEVMALEGKSISAESDHFPVLINLPDTSYSKVSPIRFTKSFIFKNGDYEGMNYFFMEENLDYIFDSNDIEFIWSTLKTIISKAISLFVPSSKRSRVNTLPQWFTPSLRNQRHKLHTTRRKAKAHPSLSSLSRLDHAEFKFQNQVSVCKSKFEADLVNNHAKSNSNKIFSYIRSISKQASIPPTVFYETKSASNDGDKANLFNHFFQSVFKPSRIVYPAQDSLLVPNKVLNNFSISEQDVYKVLAALDPSKATGPDGIPARVLKLCSCSLTQPIHHLFSQCIIQSYLPEDWRIHKVIPAFKSGNKNSVSNYRPISLLCCISKALERIIYDKISEFTTSHYISNQQYGFMKHRSTLKQLLSFMDEIQKGLSNKNHQVDVLYLDIKKAFDSVPHNELLIKLNHAGITGNTWRFFSCYLNNRKQYVSINGLDSSLVQVTSGVPQGSILGPLLFLIYINDLVNVPRFMSPFLFVDDGKLLKSVTSSSDCHSIQSDLDSLKLWSSTSCLDFNVNKSFVLQFHLPKSDNTINFKYTLNDMVLPLRDYCKDLGVIFSSDLSWSKHHSSIASKVYRIMYLIRRTFDCNVPTSCKLKLYVSLMLPHLSYCSPIWRPTLVKDIMALERIQRRARKHDIIAGNHAS